MKLTRGIITTFSALSLCLLIAIVAFGGEYHFGASLLCSECHTMHFSQTHNWDGTTPVPTTATTNGNWLGSSGPNQHLLKAVGVNNLCLACHDGTSFAPDVFGDHTNGYVRQAGALNRANGSSPYEAWKGHTLDSNLRPPGGVSKILMTCDQCHEVHGSISYRNLTGPPDGVIVTYTKGQPYSSRTKTVDVWLKQWNRGELAGNYSYDSVRFNEPVPTNGTYGDFCQGCHQRFHGSVGTTTEIGGNLTTGGFKRHPTAEVNIGNIAGEHSSIAQYNAASNRAHVLSNSSNDYLANPGSGTFTAGDGLTPSCFSCHKAHGNKNSFGLIFMGRNGGTVSEEGITTDVKVGMFNLCSQCHVQGN